MSKPDVIEFFIDDWIDNFTLDVGSATQPSYRGPDHICLAELLRREAGLSGFLNLSPSSTDVFVLGLGEGPSRYGTKIGGLPYLRQQEIWPMSSTTGLPMTFVCQFRFDESIDIVGDLPGDLLLVFCEMSNRYAESIEWGFVWKRYEGDEGLVEEIPVRPDLRSLGVIPCCYGARIRYSDYAQADVLEAMLEVVRKRKHFKKFFKELGSTTESINFVRSWACQMCVLKIGGIPYWANPVEAAIRQNCDGRFLALIPPIWGKSTTKNGWINQAHGSCEHDLFWPPDGCIHLYLNDEQEVVGRFASLSPW